MKKKTLLLLSIVWINITISNPVFSQQTENEFVYGDALPDAPELAKRGEYKVGVSTLDFVNKGQIDVLKSKGGVDPFYDRPLNVEVWYPCESSTNTSE